MLKTIDPPLKWHGGKHKLADWIISLMPARCQNPNQPEKNPADKGWLHYVEPFFGGGAVLLAMDPEGISEVVNDLNSELVNFWDVLTKPDLFARLQRQLEATPFSEEVFVRSFVVESDAPVRRAMDFFICCRQSLAGRMKGFASITRNRTRRGMNEQVSAWLNAIEGLPAVHARLKRVLIRNQPALEIIRKEDGPRTLFYLDPPYLHETRATTGEYLHEMTWSEHVELLQALAKIKGRFMLSGYRSELYDSHTDLNNWTRHEKTLPNSAAGGSTKRLMTECVWTNY